MSYKQCKECGVNHDDERPCPVCAGVSRSAAPCSAEEVDAAILSALDALYPVAMKLEKKGGAFHLNCNERGALGAWMLLSITEPDHDIPSQNVQG